MGSANRRECSGLAVGEVWVVAEGKVYLGLVGGEVWVEAIPK